MRERPHRELLAPGSGIIPLRNESTGHLVRAQYDPLSEELAFVIDGEVAAGENLLFHELTDPAEPADGSHLRATFVAKLDRVELRVGGEEFATYIVSGTRRPYFWPVLGPAGASVVRGQGSTDHPHHTGLTLNYGGHSEGGSVNLWSDWDEPPYGPGGRMIHRGFRRLEAGPVYGELVQDLTYVDARGDPFAVEVRTVRWWWASTSSRFVDLETRVLELTDRGSRPFILMIRTPGSFGIPGHGRITNSAGRQGPELIYTREGCYRSAWVDASGPTSGPPPEPPAGPPEDLPDLRASSDEHHAVGRGPWNGIALLDHPSNEGYPNVVGKYATAQQITQAHYPPADAPQGPFSFRHRVLVHDGDAEQARVSGFAADYASECRVEIE
jgi:hypothetical protein